MVMLSVGRANQRGPPSTGLACDLTAGCGGAPGKDLRFAVGAAPHTQCTRARGGCGVQVLLVEDDDRVAGALSAVLARHGMVVRRVALGREALGALGAGCVVLLGLGLADVDGGEGCRGVRAAGGVPGTVLAARGEAAA